MQSTAIIYVTKLNFICRHNTIQTTTRHRERVREREQEWKIHQRKEDSTLRKDENKKRFCIGTLLQPASWRIVTVNRLADKTIHHMRCSIKSLNKRMDSEFSGRITLWPEKYFVSLSQITEENCRNNFSSWGFCFKISSFRFHFACIFYSTASSIFCMRNRYIY